MVDFRPKEVNGSWRLERSSSYSRVSDKDDYLYERMHLCVMADEWQVMEWDSAEAVKAWLFDETDDARWAWRVHVMATRFARSHYPSTDCETGRLMFLPACVISTGFALWREQREAEDEAERAVERAVAARALFVSEHDGRTPEEYFCKCGAEPMPTKINISIYGVNGRFDCRRSFCRKCWTKHLRLERRMRDSYETRKLIGQVKGILNGNRNEEDRDDGRIAPVHGGHAARHQGGQGRGRRGA